MTTTLADKIIHEVKKMDAKKEFDKSFKSELRQLRMWQSDMQKYLKMEDSVYKFAQLNNAISAIYGLYVKMDSLSKNYKP